MQIHDEVVDDPTLLRAAEGVLGLAGGDAAKIVAELTVQVVGRAGTGHRGRAEVGDIEDTDSLPDGQVLGDHATAAVLQRHRPSGEVPELRGGLDVPIVQG